MALEDEVRLARLSLDRKPLSALGSSAFNDLLSALGAHSDEESMGAVAPGVVWLICSFHALSVLSI